MYAIIMGKLPLPKLAIEPSNNENQHGSYIIMETCHVYYPA